MPERQPGFLVNVCLFVAGSSAMARVSARGSGVCPFRTKRGSSGVGVSLVLQGHDSGGEKECGRTARKACLNGTFSSRFVRVLYSQSRAGRGLAFGGARRLCVRCAFTETAGAGTKIAGGAELSGRVTELTQRLVVLEMHVLAE